MSKRDSRKTDCDGTRKKRRKAGPKRSIPKIAYGPSNSIMRNVRPRKPVNSQRTQNKLS